MKELTGTVKCRRHPTRQASRVWPAICQTLPIL